MSHFTVLVVVDGATTKDKLDHAVSGLLAKYDENRDVPRYRKHTKQEAIALTRKEIADRKEYSYDKWQSDPVEYESKVSNPNHLAYLRGDDPERSFLKEYETIMGSDEGAWKEAIKWEDDYDEEGIYSTYNPDSKWDWWSIGGRWSGAVLNAKPQPKETDFFGKEWTPYDGGVNVVRKGDLVDFRGTFAHVTKDGEWLEKGQMGWWGIVTEEKHSEEDWDEAQRELLKFVDDNDWLVVVDCHI